MKIDFSSINKILIIQYEPWGDVLINTALFPSIRNKFPNAQIEYLVRKPFHLVLNHNPFLDDIIIFEKRKGLQYFFDRIKLIAKIRKQKYDLIIDQIRGSGSAQIVFFSGAKYRLGLKRRRWNFVYNVKSTVVALRYSASMKFDLLKPLGIKEEKYKLFYHIEEKSIAYIDSWIKNKKLEDESIIILSPGSPVPRKQWSLDNYSKLADLLIDAGYKVVLLWGPGEENDVNIIKKKMQQTPIVAPPTNFNQAAAMLAKSKILICNDGGINHLCASVGTPSLAIFGSTEPKKWNPSNLGPHHYLHNPNVNSRVDKTFGITPEEAFEKAKSILESQRSNKTN